MQQKKGICLVLAFKNQRKMVGGAFFRNLILLKIVTGNHPKLLAKRRQNEAKVFLKCTLSHLKALTLNFDAKNHFHNLGTKIQSLKQDFQETKAKTHFEGCKFCNWLQNPPTHFYSTILVSFYSKYYLPKKDHLKFLTRFALALSHFFPYMFQ